MGWARGGLILLLLLSASFAAVVEAGNWAPTESASSNASASAVARCGPDVQAVYLCSGDVVKAVSSDGSTFYKTDGSTVSCPNAAPTQIGAECVQLLMPNYCPTPVPCGTVQNQSAPVSAPGTAAANATGGNAQNASAAPSAVLATEKPPATPIITAKTQDIVIPAAAPSAADYSMDNLALVVLLLGAVSVGVLFTMFKNSISE
jgi:hypothetical protein